LYQLSLSDIGGLRYEFTGVDLSHSIKQTIMSQQLNAAEKDITIAFDDESEVMISADEKRINQLLTNVIRNSLAYTNNTGQVDVSLNVNDGHAILEIHDTPPGVTAEECKLIFEPLYRQDESRSRRSAGAGLGLAICRNIVEAHRGTITAKPSILGGLQVTIELPVLKEKGGL
jgi:two-component system sensor histidine kinase BaeS